LGVGFMTRHREYYKGEGIENIIKEKAQRIL
jgi:hypothetical protein